MSKTFKAMAGKSIGMHQLKQIVDLLIKNYSIRSIVRMSGVSRNTVREYKLCIEQSKLPLEQLSLLDEQGWFSPQFFGQYYDLN